MNAFRTRYLGSLVCSLCLVNPIYSMSSSKTIMLYGLTDDMPSKISSHKNMTYRLQLASFHSLSRANRYKSKISKMTDKPIQVVHSSQKKSVYRVIVGPFANLDSLNQVRQQLSSNAPTEHQAIQHQDVRPTPYRSFKSPKHTASTEKLVYKAPCETYTYKAGPYVGFSVGPRIMLSGSPEVYQGVEGTLALGYGHLWNQWFYLGGELFGANSVRMKNQGLEVLATSRVLENVRTTWSYGFDVMPGLMLNERTLGYVRAGVVNTTFKLKINNPFTGNVNIIKQSPTGWRAGVGTQTNFYKNLDVRLEYVFSEFEKVRNPAWGQPYDHQVNIGVVYRFV